MNKTSDKRDLFRHLPPEEQNHLAFKNGGLDATVRSFTGFTLVVIAIIKLRMSWVEGALTWFAFCLLVWADGRLLNRRLNKKLAHRATAVEYRPRPEVTDPDE